jgi:SAM-dependent methyltransferase
MTTLYVSSPAEYDATVRPLHWYTELQKAIADQFKRRTGKSKPRLLELGCGTGETTSELILAYPDWPPDFTCVDNSKKMIQATVRKTSPKCSCGILKFVACDANFWLEQHVGANLPPYDVVVTGMLLSTLPCQTRRILMGNVWNALSPGGVFITGDVYDDDVSACEDAASSESGTVKSENELFPSLTRSEQLQIAQEANYEQASFVWTHARAAVFIAVKPRAHTSASN